MNTNLTPVHWLRPDRMKLADILALVQSVYCKSIGIEYMHIVDTVKRDWIRQGWKDRKDSTT